MADLDLSYTPAHELAARIRNGSLSPVTIVENALDRIKTVNEKLNCFCFVYPEELLALAKTMEAEAKEGKFRGPLHGIPFAIKDLTPTKGKRTTLGSYAYEHWVPDTDAPIVEALKNAGGIMIGKTTTPEFAYSSFTELPLWGITRNPWNPERCAGGSSGGSGVAVATGCVPFAEGSDMGGSVRIPASFCGVLGLKPSFGRIPFTILPSQFDQISHFGPLARSVTDLCLFMQVTQGPDERDIQSLKPALDFLQPKPTGLKGKRLGLLLDFGNRLWNPDVEAAIRQGAAVLRKAGAEIEEVKLSWSLDQDELWSKHWSVYLASFFGHVLPKYRNKMDPIVLAVIERGLKMSAVEFKQLEFGRTEMWKELSPILERCDAISCPTMAQPAPTHGRSDQDFWRLDDQGRYLALDVTSCWNFVSQCPALSIPAGLTKDGLPIGLQVIGRRFDDLTPIGIAAVMEKQLPWADQRPPIRPCTAGAVIERQGFWEWIMSGLRTGGQVLVDALKNHGVDMAFAVPGESYLAVLDALHDASNQIRLITCRQEGGAAYMAEAYGKLTGKPGICLVTRGPGASNATVGLHTAFQDSTPMILLIGQVAREQAEREAFQEVDFRRMFGQVTKWTAQIEDARRIPEYISQAFHRAVNGRPGPVALALPEDMLTDLIETKDAGHYVTARGNPSAEQMAELRDRLAKAKRPFVILGGGGWDGQAVADIQSFAENMNLPVGASFRCQDFFDNDHKNYAGDVGIGINPKLGERVKNADLLLVVGARLGEMTTSGYTLLEPPVPQQTLVHVHASPEELGRVYQAALPINSGMQGFAKMARELKPVDHSAWDAQTTAAHAEFEAWQKHDANAGPVQMGEIIAYLRDKLPKDAIITNGAGNYATWFHRFYRWRSYRTQLAPTNGSMGYGVPAGVAAKLVHPDRIVVSANGDGCFLMNGQEIATAVQHNANVIFLVINNGMYGTIRMHQERDYPGRVSGTDLKNPDFAALARAYGAHGETVRATNEFAPAFERSLKAGKPALIEIVLDPEALTPRLGLSQIRANALKNK